MFNDLFKTSLVLLMSVAALSVAAAYDMGNTDQMKSDFEKEKMHKWGDKMGEPIAVEIDIENDSLDLTNESDPENSVLEVAVLGSENFDVNNIDPSSLAIGDVNGGEFLVFDQNNDGIADLVAEFSVADLNLQEGAQELTLKGKTRDGKMFKGSDQITVTKAN